MEFEANTLTPKHITVIALSDNVAVAHLYVEGAIRVRGEQGVSNYLTRGTMVMILEDGEWVTRAAHWCAPPLRLTGARGGAGA